MARCRRCDTTLEGRRQLCDACKASRPGTADTVKARRGQSANKAAAKPPRKKSAASTSTAAAPKRPKDPPTPPGLHQRGRELWSTLGQAAGTALGELALEICRGADRLDELDRIVAGKGVMQLMQFRLADEVWFDADGDQRIHVKVSFQSVLTEARLQQATFKELLKEYRAAAAVAESGTGSTRGPTPGTPAPAAPPATGMDQLAARRAEREQSTG